MNKKIMSFIVVVTLVVGLAVGFVMGGVIKVPFVNANTEVTSENVTADPIKALEGKKIYMSGGYHGFALSDAEAEELMKETEEMGYSSVFTMLYSTGKDLVDPKSGVTFRVLSDVDEVAMCDGAYIYDVGGMDVYSLTGGRFDGSKLDYVGDVDTSYGGFSLFR